MNVINKNVVNQCVLEVILWMKRFSRFNELDFVVEEYEKYDIV